MLKRVLYGSGAAGALAAAFLMGSVMLQGVGAQGPAPRPSPQATAPAGAARQEQEPRYSGSVPAPTEQTGQSEQDEATALQGLAKITADQAKAAALVQFPGATVQKIELDDENGSVVYSVELIDSAGQGQDVKVDAGNAKVLHVEVDGPEGSEGGVETAGERD